MFKAYFQLYCKVYIYYMLSGSIYGPWTHTSCCKSTWRVTHLQKKGLPLLKRFFFQKTLILFLCCFFLSSMKPLLQMVPLYLQPETHKQHKYVPCAYHKHINLLNAQCYTFKRHYSEKMVLPRNSWLTQETRQTCFDVFLLFGLSTVTL